MENELNYGQRSAADNRTKTRGDSQLAQAMLLSDLSARTELDEDQGKLICCPLPRDL